MVEERRNNGARGQTPGRSTSGRRNRRKGKGRGTGEKKTLTNENRFVGKYTEMNGHVFQCHHETDKRDQFDKSVEELNRYASTYLNNSRDIRTMLLTQREVSFVEPQDPPFSFSLTQRKIWEKEVDLFIQRKEDYNDNKHVIFSIIIGQCSTSMKTQLKMNEDYQQWEDTLDVVSLLTEILAISERFDSRTYFLEAYINAITAFYSMKQGPQESINDYLTRFRKIIKVAEHYGASLTDDEVLMKHELFLSGYISSMKDDISNLTYDQDVMSEVASERLKAYILVIGADKKRFRDLHKSLRDSMTLQQNMYPTTIGDAVSVLQKFELHNPSKNKKNEQPSQQQHRQKDKVQEPKEKKGDEGGKDGVSLFQQNEGIPSTTEPTENKISEAEVQLLQQVIENDENDSEDNIHFLFTQTDVDIVLTQPSGRINRNWILLDNQSTCHIFNNKHLFKNVRPCKPGQEIKIQSNGNGSIIVYHVGDLPGIGEVHYHFQSIANALSFSKVAKLYRITFDNSVTDCFIVHGNHRKVKFLRSEHGLFYHNCAAPRNENTSLVQTVKANEEQFTHRQVSQARLARRLYIVLGRPSEKDFISFIRANGLKNCPVDVDDAHRSFQIYGPDIGAPRGKTVRHQPQHVLVPTISSVPPEILRNHGKVQICADICFVNNVPFLITISRNLKLRTVDDVKDTKDATILDSLQDVIKIYTSRGFDVEYIHADNGFHGLSAKLLPIRLNLASAGEHVSEVERSIRTLKERTRAAIHGLPFRRHPTQLIIANVRYHNSWLNRFPASDDVSSTLSPRQIVWGDNTDFNLHCKSEFGSYCEVFQPNQTTNTPAARTVGSLALYPANNLQGGYRFLYLTTGRLITRNQWVEVLMPPSAIEATEQLAKKQKQPDISKHGYVFSWRKIRSFPADDISPANIPDAYLFADEGADDDAENSDNNSDSDDTSYSDSDNDDETLIADTDNESSSDSSVASNEDNDDASTSDSEDSNGNDDNNDNDDAANIINDSEEQDPTSDNDANQGADPIDDKDQGAQDDHGETQDDHDNEPAQDQGVDNNTAQQRTAKKGTYAEAVKTKLLTMRRNTGYNLRQTAKKAKSFRRRFDRLHFQFLQFQSKALVTKRTGKQIAEYVQTQILLTQMSAKKGVAKHGEKAVMAIIKDFAQLDEKDVFQPLKRDQLTKEQLAKAMRTITVIKEKRCGRIKGRTVADGRTQRNFVAKDDTSSPTVGTESLFLSLVIDAHEGRYVVTADVVGAFLLADMEEFTVVKIDGPMVSYLVRANPAKFASFVTYEGSRKVIYLKLKKALYGCMQSSLLWWKLLTSTLIEKMGFELNPYDLCVANKIVNGNQLTVLWYVDDLKISHIEQEVLEDTIKKLEGFFGTLTMTTGSEHTYVGMKVDIKDGKVQVHNIEYIEECFELSGEPITASAATPAKGHLFEVNEDRDPLDSKLQKTFHSCVAKLLFIAKRGRPDILTAISFLTTRVTKPNVDDWGKLRRTLQYLRGTLDFKLTLSADFMSILKTWVDASYAPHHAMRSHTGGCSLFGNGVVMSRSSKQKLNSKSSTEAEVIGVSDILPYNLWTVYFLKAQGYEISCNILYQDNQSAIRLERNGLKSAGNKLRHINIRFFWIKDCAQREEINIIYCPTYRMLADFLTKPLQGTLFQIFRDVIMGIKHVSFLHDLIGLPRKERVENSKNNEVRESPTIAHE